MDFGRALRVSRAARGISQQELAEKAGFSPSYVSLIESGRREPTMAAMRKLAAAMALPVDILILLSLDHHDQQKASGEAVSRLADTLLAALTACSPQGST